jgi:predicted Zn-dependent protease
VRGNPRIAIAIVTASLTIASSASAAEPERFLGFRLLDLENQSVKWETPHRPVGATVTYAFATKLVTTEGARNCGQMLPPDKAYTPSGIAAHQFEREVAAAFRMWEDVADIKFRKVDDDDGADIVIGAQAVPVGRAFTNVELEPAGKSGKKVIARSLICLNPAKPWKVGFDGDLDVYDLRYTIAHEAGHAIGLDHPSPSGQLMSYKYDERHHDLQPGDIKGAALLYGPRNGGPSFARAASDIDTGSTTAGPGDDVGQGQDFGIGAGPDKPQR